jgi:hypothetical protein
LEAKKTMIDLSDVGLSGDDYRASRPGLGWESMKKIEAVILPFLR